MATNGKVNSRLNPFDVMLHISVLLYIFNCSQNMEMKLYNIVNAQSAIEHE